jgi:hypothetical protein
MTSKRDIKIVGLTIKTIVVHTVTYMVVGLLAFLFLNYSEGFASPELACWMRQTDDPVVTAGPLIQPIRGIIFGLAFFPIREVLFGKKYGWLITWWLLVALGILSTFGPAPGSVEGLLYTILPVSFRTYLEIGVQSFLLSGLLFIWVNNPQKKWLNWVLGVLFSLTIFLSIMGVITSGLI